MRFHPVKQHSHFFQKLETGHHDALDFKQHLNSNYPCNAARLTKDFAVERVEHVCPGAAQKYLSLSLRKVANMNKQNISTIPKPQRKQTFARKGTENNF